MMNNSYNINYSKIIFENGKLIEPSLDEKITLAIFLELKDESQEKILSLNKNLINYIDFPTGNTLLHISVFKEQYNLTNILIKKGHKINIKNFSKETPLHLSIITKNHRIINLLPEKNANPKKQI